MDAREGTRRVWMHSPSSAIRCSSLHPPQRALTAAEKGRSKAPFGCNLRRC
jgi:hypothetical protein